MPEATDTIDVACFGGAHVDLIAQAHGPLVMATSNPGTVQTKPGGVALNVALALNDLGRRVALVGAVGADGEGDWIKSALSACGIDTSQLQQSTEFPTGRYVAVEGIDGELSVAVSDTAALDHLEAPRIDASLQALTGVAYWFADCNLPAPLLQRIARHANRPKLAIDAVSVAKSAKLSNLLGDIDVLCCNIAEAAAIVGRPLCSVLDAVNALADAGVPSCVVTNGADPVGIHDGAGCLEIAVPDVTVSSVTGAGDTLVAASIDALLAGADLAEAVTKGIDFAGRKLSS